MNKKTLALTEKQYTEIIETMRTGFAGSRPNDRIATALVIQANCGLRIGDVLSLTMRSFVRDGNRYRLDITEQKTGKERFFTIPNEIFLFLDNYRMRNQIKPNEPLFDISERAVQKQLKIVCDYLNYPGISTHSFRKYFATSIYENSGKDIALVQRLLQHTSAATTQRYIGIEPERIEKALQNHIKLV